jgi:hypothetical protein
LADLHVDYGDATGLGIGGRLHHVHDDERRHTLAASRDGQSRHCINWPWSLRLAGTDFGHSGSSFGAFGRAGRNLAFNGF